MAFLKLSQIRLKPVARARMAILFVFLVGWCTLSTVWAGPYAPAAGEACSHAISMNDPAITDWADAVSDYQPGPYVDATWQDEANALGPAEGTSFDIVCLGRGGEITLTFDPPISNGSGWDLAIFENAFQDTFIELAYVEVSSNGVDFVQFDSVSLTISPVPAFGNLDPSDVDGLAGKYRQGYGTPFDLDDLSDKALVISGSVDLNAITHVRIVDIIGDGSYTDSSGRSIYDPYPTTGSAGFDLDAVGVSNGAAYPPGECDPGDDTAPAGNGDSGVGGSVGCFISVLAGH